jgi:proteasome lid subunit RPN8/RPN11
MMTYARTHVPAEVLGLIFGGVIGDALVVREAEPFRVGTHTGVAFVDEDYERAVPLVHQAAARGNEWVGWFHSHPFGGKGSLYLSAVDIAHHRPAQRQNPLWTALVLDPLRLDDSTTTRGLKAFRLDLGKRWLWSKGSVVELIAEIK